MWPSIVYILLILVSVTSVNSSKLLPLRYNGASISMKCHNDAAYSSTEINKYGKKGCITQSRSKSCSFRGCIPLAVNTGLEPYNEGKYTTDQGNLFLSFIKQKKVTDGLSRFVVISYDRRHNICNFIGVVTRLTSKATVPCTPLY